MSRRSCPVIGVFVGRCPRPSQPLCCNRCGRRAGTCWPSVCRPCPGGRPAKAIQGLRGFRIPQAEVSGCARVSSCGQIVRYAHLTMPPAVVCCETPTNYLTQWADCCGRRRVQGSGRALGVVQSNQTQTCGRVQNKPDMPYGFIQIRKPAQCIRYLERQEDIARRTQPKSHKCLLIRHAQITC